MGRSSSVMMSQDAAFIYILQCYQRHAKCCVNACEASHVLSLVMGKQDEKKGNEWQTENIRIIEISGKIFCVATCQPVEVMTPAYALLSDKHQTLLVRMGNITKCQNY